MQDRSVSDFLKKVQSAKKESKVDLSSGEDLSIAVMNLVSLEEHFFFTGEKTGKGKYLDLLKKVRDMRKELLAKIVKNPEGEAWCISKHLLAAAMRLFEVGTKMQSQGKTKEAEDLFAKSYELYNMFWGINLKIIDIGKVKKIEGKINVMDKIGAVIKKIVDYCIE